MNKYILLVVLIVVAPCWGMKQHMRQREIPLKYQELSVAIKSETTSDSPKLVFTACVFPSYDKMCEIVGDERKMSAILWYQSWAIDHHIELFMEKCVEEKNLGPIYLLVKYGFPLPDFLLKHVPTGSSMHQELSYLSRVWFLIDALYSGQFKLAAKLIMDGSPVDAMVIKALRFQRLSNAAIADYLRKTQIEIESARQSADTSADSGISLGLEKN